MKPRFPRVEVCWFDAASKDPWRDLEDLEERETVECITRGFLIRETKREILIAVTVTECGQFHSTMAIPKRMVVSIRKPKRA